MYFSFPQKRSATPVLSESVEGRFLLSYLDGQLTETIQKQAWTYSLDAMVTEARVGDV